MRNVLIYTVVAAAMLLAPVPLRYAAAEHEPSADEIEAIEALDAAIDGAIVYTRKGRVRKMTIGDWRPVDLGEGEYARWSRDGRHIAVYDDGRVYVMAAGGGERRELPRGDQRDGCPIEFHVDNRHIIYWKKDSGFWMVNIESGETTEMDLPGTYTGEPGISADGKRLVARWGQDLYAIDLIDGAHRKYARGCSPGISPDGQRIMSNRGGHRRLDICNWDGGEPITLDTRTAYPDPRWDNQHWSNHNNYLTAQGEGDRAEAYIVHVATNTVTRVTWEGEVRAPDLWVKPTRGPRPTCDPVDAG